MIWSRHLGCIGVYFVFAGRQSRNKSLLTIGGMLSLLLYLYMSAVLLYNMKTWLNGQYMCFIITVLLVCWRIYVRPDRIERDILKLLVCCIFIASVMIPVDEDVLIVDSYMLLYSFKTTLQWIVSSVSVCSLNILIGFLILVKREVLALTQRFC